MFIIFEEKLKKKEPPSLKSNFFLNKVSKKELEFNLINF